MDWTTVIAVGGSFILSIGAVWAVVGKILPKAGKYIMIAKEAIDIAQEVIDSLKDGKIDAAEIAEIQKEINELKAALKA